MAKVSFSYDDKRLKRNLRGIGRDLNDRVGAVVDYDAAWGQGWMRSNASWTDDTGAARGGLLAVPGHFGTAHEIFLTYSVHYGIWLEVANSGKYQVLQPALRIIGAKLMSDLQHLLDRA